MRSAIVAGMLLSALVGCAAEPMAPRSSAGECPAPPAFEFSPQSTLGPDAMDQVAEETTRYANQLVGMREDTARACAESEGYTWRVFEEDGESFALTMDYRPTRINVGIEAGVVTEVYSG